MRQSTIPHRRMVRPGAPLDAPLLSRLARHPEFGAFVAAVALITFFAIVGRDAGFLSLSATAGWLNAAAELGIVVVPVALLMIAGEFDLSVGSVLGGATIITAAGSGYYDLPLFVSVAIALAFGVVVGLGNGLLVNRTRLPSFIVTLAANYVCLGVALGASRALTGTSTISLELSGFWKQLFAAKVGDFNIAILWWLAICAVAVWVLRRTPFGAWIYATGGDAEAARRAGVPTARLKMTLFVATAAASALCGVIQTAEFNSGNAVSGQGFVFQAPIVAVIGGILLSGGYGSVIGAALGTLTFGIVGVGLSYTGWSTDWTSAVIGVLLVLAVIGNNAIRNLALARGPGRPRRESTR